MRQIAWTPTNADLAQAEARLLVAADRTTDPDRVTAMRLLALDIHEELAGRAWAARVARRIKAAA